MRHQDNSSYGSNESVKATLKARGICVVIPTYNNAGTLAKVVREALYYCADVIVVNDGSTDETTQILQGVPNINVVDYARNRGKGYALKKGFKKALSLGFAYAITIDADGQHLASDIPLLLHANQEYPGALIVGERNLEGVQRSKGSDFANKFSNFWFYIQTGRKLSDTQTGYRLYPLRKLYGLKLLTSRYEAELELLVFSSWHGVRLVSVPIHVYYPPKEERVSHFRPGKDFLRISVLNTVLCGLAIVYGLPLRIGRLLLRIFRTVFSLLFFSFFMFLVITPLSWVYAKTGIMTDHKRDNLRKVIYHAARFIMLRAGIPGTKFSYEVKDNINFNQARVVICNHQSHLDLMCLLIFTPNVIFLTNDWVWNNPFYGFLIRAAEYYPIHEGIEQLLPKLDMLARKGYSIAVFPEGTRSKDCSIGRFHQGAFHIAEQLGLDILPMCLYGPGKVLPKKKYLLNKWPIRIEVEEPITISQLKDMGDNKAQASKIRAWYKRKYERMSNEIEQYV